MDELAARVAGMLADTEDWLLTWADPDCAYDVPEPERLRKVTWYEGAVSALKAVTGVIYATTSTASIPAGPPVSG